jgi:hypothetical protein
MTDKQDDQRVPFREAFRIWLLRNKVVKLHQDYLASFADEPWPERAMKRAENEPLNNKERCQDVSFYFLDSDQRPQESG